jgi:hypothetical protein
MKQGWLLRKPDGMADLEAGMEEYVEIGELARRKTKQD